MNDRYSHSTSRYRYVIQVLLLGWIGVMVSDSVLAQQVSQGEYIPYRFTDTVSGEGLYFGYLVRIETYIDRYLIVTDDQGDDLYFLDVESKSGCRVGREGGGPGEYRYGYSGTALGDTLYVNHDGVKISRYLLPDLTFLDVRTLKNSVTGERLLWNAGGGFYCADLPMSHFGEGLFARYSDTGELLEIFGSFDRMERYGEGRMLQITMNNGELHWLPTGELGFFYGYQPRFLLFTPQGEQHRDIKLDMPWQGEKEVNPFYSEQFGTYAARSLVASVTIIEDGFVIASNGYDKKQKRAVAVLAQYDWDGTLQKIIELPMPVDPEPLEGRLHGATVLDGRYFVIVNGDPAVREVIVKPEQEQ